MSSILLVRPGDLVGLDPNDKRVIAFDWDFENLRAGTEIMTSLFVVRVLKQNGATPLTFDQDSLLTAADATIAIERTVVGDNRVALVRLDATTATLGDVYEFANRITDNQTPSKQSEQSIKVQIRNG